jgi:hypothetical protein
MKYKKNIRKLLQDKVWNKKTKIPRKKLKITLKHRQKKKKLNFLYTVNQLKHLQK